MNQAVRWIGEDHYNFPEARPARRLSFLRLLLRYPIFLLAFGPPLFRSGAIDATKGKIDLWSVLQVGLLSSIALRAIYRLAAPESILIPKQIRSVLKFAFFLGVLFLTSVTYSPSRMVSMAYAVLYFLTFACVVEFIVDVYRNPLNWMQCLLHLRFIALLLLALDFIVLPFNPNLILGFEEGAGLRFGGGGVGPVALICPMIAIISAFTFLHSLEPRRRSAFLFLVGLAGSLSLQSRGCSLALLLSLSILAFGWAKTGKRSAYILISGFMAFVLFFGVVMGEMGGGRIWTIVNRGESSQRIATASGRFDVWQFVIHYCLRHPQGMGYVAGFRMIFKDYHAVGMNLDPSHIGNAHNCYFQVLSDAGWLALAVYLTMLVKIVGMAWRFANKRAFPSGMPDSQCRESTECLMFMLVYLLAVGMDTSGPSVPLSAPFYWQNIIVALILGISANMILASRTRVTNSAN
jgi:hypothetical protein